jgi:glycosyl-4,4'-diaponeurosporenoate acyltransferase
MIVHLSGPWAIVINITVWLVINLGVGMSTARMQPNSFNPQSWLYRQRIWERGGKTYKARLKVQKWKRLLPAVAAVVKGGFRKKHVGNADAAYVRRFILETCRAEFTHWVILLFSLIFFLWNDWWIGLIMVAYGLATNMPCIVTQRYNRMRLERIYARYNRD